MQALRLVPTWLLGTDVKTTVSELFLDGASWHETQPIDRRNKADLG